MSESNRISFPSVKVRSILIIEFMLTSFCVISAQKSESASGIDNITSIIRNSSACITDGFNRLSLLTVFPGSLRVYSGEGGTTEIVIMSNSDWYIKCIDKWLSADTETGGGFSRVVFTVKENPEAFERIGRIKVKIKGLPVRIIELSQKARHDE